MKNKIQALFMALIILGTSVNVFSQTTQAAKPQDAAIQFLTAYTKFLNSKPTVSADVWAKQQGTCTSTYLAKLKTALASYNAMEDNEPIYGVGEFTPPAPFTVKSYDEKTGRVICSAGKNWDVPVMIKQVGDKWVDRWLRSDKCAEAIIF